MTSKLQDAIDKLLRELKETADESGIDGTTVLRQAEAINRLKEQLTAARQREEEAKEEISRLRELIATGHSRGAAISPFVRDVFSAGSKAAAERDALTQERDALRAENDRLTLAASESARTLQVEMRLKDERIWFLGELVGGNRIEVLVKERDALQAQVTALREALANQVKYAYDGEKYICLACGTDKHEPHSPLCRVGEAERLLAALPQDGA